MLSWHCSGAQTANSLSSSSWNQSPSQVSHGSLENPFLTHALFTSVLDVLGGVTSVIIIVGVSLSIFELCTIWWHAALSLCCYCMLHSHYAITVCCTLVMPLLYAALSLCCYCTLHSRHAVTVCLYHFVLLVERHQVPFLCFMESSPVSARDPVGQESSELKKVMSRRQGVRSCHSGQCRDNWEALLENLQTRDYCPHLLKCLDFWNISIHIKGILLYYYCYYCLLFIITFIQGMYSYILEFYFSLDV